MTPYDHIIVQDGTAWNKQKQPEIIDNNGKIEVDRPIAHLHTRNALAHLLFPCIAWALDKESMK